MNSTESQVSELERLGTIVRPSPTKASAAAGSPREAGIDAGDDLNGAAELLWACYMVLDTARSRRAHEVLIRAHSVLTERAKLLDEADRTTFLGDVPSHRAIMTAWAALSSKAT